MISVLGVATCFSDSILGIDLAPLRLKISRAGHYCVALYTPTALPKDKTDAAGLASDPHRSFRPPVCLWVVPDNPRALLPIRTRRMLACQSSSPRPPDHPDLPG